jgi:hypothetical protein
MDSSVSMMIVEYSKTTKNVCICLAIAVFLIILFMVSPIKNFMMTSLIGKMVILVLLGYIMYYNTNQTLLFSQKVDMSLFSGDWNPVKTNILCGYLFTLFIFILALNVIRKMF